MSKTLKLMLIKFYLLFQNFLQTLEKSKYIGIFILFVLFLS